MQARAPALEPDRVRAEDLSRLAPGTGVAGPEAAPYPSRLDVQAASFVTRKQAERAPRRGAEFGPSGIYTANVDDQLRYRVRIEPLRPPERGERVREALVRRGCSDAIIVRD